MSYKELKTRIKHKYKTLEEWTTENQASPISLLYGEICYGIDDKGNLYQKIGNNPTGEVLFSDLPWILNQSDWDETDNTLPTYIKNKPDNLLTADDVELEISSDNANDEKIPTIGAVKNYVGGQLNFDTSNFLTKDSVVKEIETDKTYDEYDIPNIDALTSYIDEQIPDDLVTSGDLEGYLIGESTNVIDENSTRAQYPTAAAVYGSLEEYTQANQQYISDLKGAANGLVPLNNQTKIDASYLPSYVDDVIEGYYFEGNFYKDVEFDYPITGESGKIYIRLNGGGVFRWSGSAFIEIPNLPNLVNKIDGNSTENEIASAKAIYELNASNQSDYEESDINSLSYIKNRPFYSDFKSIQTIIPESTSKYVYNEEFGLYLNTEELVGEYPGSVLPPMFAGYDYKIKIDGEEFITELITVPDISNEGLFIGNPHLVMNDLPESKYKENFCGMIQYYSGDEKLYVSLMLGFKEAAEPNQHTIEFSYLEEKVPLINISIPVEDFPDLGEGYKFGYIETDAYNNEYHYVSTEILLYWESIINISANGKIIDSSKLYGYDGGVYLGNGAMLDGDIDNNLKDYLIYFDLDGNTISYMGKTDSTTNIELYLELPNYPKYEVFRQTIPSKYIDIEVPYSTGSTYVQFDREVYAPIDGSTKSLTTAFKEINTSINTTNSNLTSLINSKPHLTYGGQKRQTYGTYATTEGWSTNSNAPTGYHSWVEGQGGNSSIRAANGNIEIERITNDSGTTTNLYLVLSNTYETFQNLRQYAFVDFNLRSGDTSTKYSANISRIFYKNNCSYVQISWTSYTGDNSLDISDDTYNGRQVYITFFNNLGDNSHSENTSTAYGVNSHAQGNNTLAYGQDQFTLGRYNQIDTQNKYSVIVGNGTGDVVRSNMHTLDWEGNAWYSGTITASKFIGAEEEAFGKITENYLVLNDIETSKSYVLQIKNGQLITEEQPAVIFVDNLPNKMSYQVGEQFDPTGMTILAGYHDGTTKTINNFTCSYTDSESFNEAGEIEIIIKAKCPALLTTTIVVEVIATQNLNDELQDFKYTINTNGTYQLTEWKQTYNGEDSTILSIPNNSMIIV